MLPPLPVAGRGLQPGQTCGGLQSMLMLVRIALPTAPNGPRKAGRREVPPQVRSLALAQARQGGEGLRAPGVSAPCGMTTSSLR